MYTYLHIDIEAIHKGEDIRRYLSIHQSCVSSAGTITYIPIPTLTQKKSCTKKCFWKGGKGIYSQPVLPQFNAVDRFPIRWIIGWHQYSNSFRECEIGSWRSMENQRGWHCHYSPRGTPQDAHKHDDKLILICTSSVNLHEIESNGLIVKTFRATWKSYWTCPYANHWI